MEINPNHPVTKEMHDLWHRMVGVLLWKHCGGKDTITVADMRGFNAANPDCAVIFHAHPETVELKIVTVEEGLRLARETEEKGGIAT
jgi:hypothetical protein